MGVHEDLQELLELVKRQDERVKEKKFRLPFGKKIGKQKRKKNFVTVLIINENGNLDFKKYQIEDQTILHDKIPRLAASGYVTYWKKNPFIILPNWSVEPFIPFKEYQRSLSDGSNKVGYKILMEAMYKEQTKKKPKMGGAIKWIVIIVIAAIIGYALLSGGGV